MNSHQRRERAREAQRRSRAQRRKDLAGLQARTQVLEQALEELTDVCLQFSDTVLPSISRDSPYYLKQGVKDFVSRVLSVTRNVMEGEEDDEDVKPELRPGAQEESIAIPTSRASEAHAISPLQGPSQSLAQLSPRLTYGLWPSTSSQTGQAPFDIRNYLNPTRFSNSSFGTSLFWNALSFANTVLDTPDSTLWRRMFFYSVQLYSPARVKAQLVRRLKFRPDSIRLCVPISMQDPTSHNLSSSLDLEDVEYEAQALRKDHEAILRRMTAVQDSLDAYLEAADVEAYLASRWGVNMSQLSPSSVEGFAKMSTISTTSRIVSYLARYSTCLGDRVGFPIKAVDEAVKGMMRVNVR